MHTHSPVAAQMDAVADPGLLKGSIRIKSRAKFLKATPILTDHAHFRSKMACSRVASSV